MIYTLKESVSFWEKLGENQRSSSLATAKFVHLAKDYDSKIDTKHKKKAINAIVKGEKLSDITTAWEDFLTTLWENRANRPCELLFATPEAPLLINLSGGVMENAGLSLDPLSGAAVIPGSAVKGCTRRMAMWDLSQEQDSNNKAELLASIALIFGWGDQEWKSGRAQNGTAYSDFWLAMAPYDNSISQTDADRQRQTIWEDIVDKAKDIIQKHTSSPAKNGFSGLINFLPSYPHNNGIIECDIITTHHSKYYKGELKEASDTEDPIPINLPCIKFDKQNYFSFALTTSKPQDNQLLSQAIDWLRKSLVTFGIGAKTSAGYGWFSFKRHESKLNGLKADEEKKRKIAKEFAEKAAKQSKMTPLELKIDELSNLSDSDFASTLKSSAEADEITKKAFAFLFQTNNDKKDKYKTWKKKKPVHAEIVTKLITDYPQA